MADSKIKRSAPLPAFDLGDGSTAAMRRYFPDKQQVRLEDIATRLNNRDPYEKSRDEHGSIDSDIELPSMASLKKVAKK
jgi:hypothetical protein